MNFKKLEQKEVTMNELEIYEWFLKFEDENEFFNYKYKNMQVWDIGRHFFYKLITTNELSLNNKITDQILPRNTQINSYIENHLIDLNKSLKHYDIVLMGTPRRVKQSDGLYYDVCTDYLQNILDRYSTVVIEDPLWNQFTENIESHRTPSASNEILYTDNIAMNFYKEYFTTSNLDEDKIKLTEIFTKISLLFIKHFNLDYSKAISNAVLQVIYILFNEKFYCNILKQINPKAVLMVFHPNPSSLCLIHCTKLLNIPVAEIQHGIIGEFEPIWHKFYNKNIPHTLPDLILALSPKIVFEKDMILTNANNRIKYVGYPYLEYKVNENKTTNTTNLENKKYILFVSQTNIGGKLSLFASKLADLLKDKPEYEIIYKLHPFEQNKEYPHLIKENVSIIRNSEHDIYYYDNLSTFQIGVYSTAIYEGLQFNLTTIIVDGLMGSHEAMQILKDTKDVYFTKTAEQALDIILKSNSNKNNTIQSNFWTKLDKNYYLKTVDELINKK